MEKNEGEKYKKVTNLQVQVDLNVAFDKLLTRVLADRPTASINVKVGQVLAKYNPMAGKLESQYTFTF